MIGNPKAPYGSAAVGHAYDVTHGATVSGVPAVGSTGGHHHRRHHDHPWVRPSVLVWPWYPAYYYPYLYGPTYPSWYRPEGCPPPLLSGCRTLNITGRWASSCFLPRYQYLRRLYGADWQALASAIAREEAPGCSMPPITGAGVEYLRRVQLAVAVLLNAEGYNVPYPPPPVTPRPPGADQILQPWMRALLTGWP